MSVTANITVSFGAETGAGVDGHLSAEIDDREDGLNGGDTSFAPGDTAYFLVFKSANVTYDAPVCSAGSIQTASAGSVEREEELTFADTDTATLQVPCTGSLSVLWLGRSLGSLTLIDPMTVKASAKGVAVAKVTYSATADAFGLTSPSSLNGLTDFSILVFILGHIAGETEEP